MNKINDWQDMSLEQRKLWLAKEIMGWEPGFLHWFFDDEAVVTIINWDIFEDWNEWRKLEISVLGSVSLAEAYVVQLKTMCVLRMKVYDHELEIPERAECLYEAYNGLLH